MNEMIEVYLFGPLKKIFNPTAKLSEETVIHIPYIPKENLESLLVRLNLSKMDFGEIFINHSLVKTYNDTIPNDARVAIFSKGMFLIDGGLYLKKWIS